MALRWHRPRGFVGKVPPAKGSRADTNQLDVRPIEQLRVRDPPVRPELPNRDTANRFEAFAVFDRGRATDLDALVRGHVLCQADADLVITPDVPDLNVVRCCGHRETAVLPLVPHRRQEDCPVFEVGCECGTLWLF